MMKIDYTIVTDILSYDLYLNTPITPQKVVKPVLSLNLSPLSYIFACVPCLTSDIAAKHHYGYA